MALTVFKTVRDLTTSGWVGSIPMHSRHSTVVPRSPHVMSRVVRPLTLVTVALAAALPLAAQRPDSAARPVPTPLAQSTAVAKAPLGARQAMLYSMLAPGYSQTVLGRHKAAVAFLLVEGISLAMIRESAADVHEARRAANDSIVVSYVDASGNLAVTRGPPRFGDKELHSRSAHVEDWIALLVANHLFAGADAFVAANLWDVRVRLGLRTLPGGGRPGATTTAVVASLAW